MTRSVQATAKHPEPHPFRISILEMLVVVAINLVWLVTSLLMH
jgi:hypothetical protein